MDGRSTLESVQELDTAYFPPIISVPASLTLKNPDWGGRRRRRGTSPRHPALETKRSKSKRQALGAAHSRRLVKL